jgi:hypothetical protein
LLIDIINYFEKDTVEPNLAFWLYECVVLSEMGFRIDLTNNEMSGYEFPDPSEGKHSLEILHTLVNGNIEQITFNEVLQKDKKIISNYLYKQLCYHFEGFDRLKSFKVARAVLKSV